jgi:hypothetical protein
MAGGRAGRARIRPAHEALFDARRDETIATLPADRPRRISGIEAVFENRELVFTSMANARKGADFSVGIRGSRHG